MKWLLQNTRKRLLFAARNPGYAFRALVRELTLADERFLAAATGATPMAIRGFLDEPINIPTFADHLRRCEAVFKQFALGSADLYAKKVLIQYAVVRALAPHAIVETGVANGVSSSYLLLALHRNGKGHLHSIEVGDSSYLPAGSSNGWAVPDWLRDRWTMHLGDSKTLLPDLLARLGSIDIFIHDSLHTSEHMYFEFQVAHPYLRPGGLLLADDALWNASFRGFAGAVRAPAAQVIRGVGVLRK